MRNSGKQKVIHKTEKKLDLFSKQYRISKMNSGNTTDSLAVLLAKCEADIQALRQQLAVLEAKRENLILFQQESKKITNPQSEPDKFREIGLTEAAEIAINDLWKIRGTSSSVAEIKNYLLAHGFQATTNFDNAIYGILARLIVRNRILFGKGHGIKTFLPKT